MEHYNKEFLRIKDFLLKNPHGLTVSEISKKLNVNRNSVAKYLDVLTISGQIVSKRVGPAKLFFLSDRVPLSTMLNMSSDYILVLDRHMNIVQANDNILNLMKIRKEDMLGKNILRTPHKIFNSEGISIKIKNALKGKDSSEELSINKPKQEFYFKAKFIPTTFESGELGVTIIMENITEAKETEKALHIKDYAIESSINAIAFADLEGDLTYVNSSFLKIWGYDNKKEVIGRCACKFWQAEDKAEDIVNILREKGGWVGNLTAKRKDGSFFDVQVSTNMIKDGSGNPLCMMASFVKS